VFFFQLVVDCINQSTSDTKVLLLLIVYKSTSSQF